MRWRIILLVVLLWSLIPVRPVAAQLGSDSISLAAYWDLVIDSRAIATLQVWQSPSEARLALLSLAERWEAVNSLQLEDGTQLPIDTSAWVALMRADPPNPKALVERFDRLLAERNRLSAQRPADLARLQEILSRPEFQQAPQKDWFQELLNRFLQWLAGDRAQQETNAPETVQVTVPNFLIEGLAAVALALVLAYVLRSLFSDFVSDSAYLDQAEMGDEPITAQVALSRAENFSSQGNFRVAVRYLYLSALLILDERGLLYYDRTKTNREYLRAVANNAVISGLLRSVIDVFDRVWYGFQPLDAETYQRYAEQVRQLEEQQ